MTKVVFEFYTGIHRNIFRNVRLSGSWTPDGRYSDDWTTVAMTPFFGDDGCPAWRATVELSADQSGWTFHWGVVLDSPHKPNVWAITTEIGPAENPAQHCDFVLSERGQTERYWLTNLRRLGANKHYRNGVNTPAVRFSVWAPYAKKVETVIGETAGGYIWNDGRGVVQSFAMTRDAYGFWTTDSNEPALSDFARWDHQPYMYRICREDGSIVYRTDLYSRCQIGSGKTNPELESWDGRRQSLDGTKSCSVVVDPERITAKFSDPKFPETEWLDDNAFWANEFDPLRPLPARIEDMVIYEMHVGGLWTGHAGPGTLQDAIDMLDYLVDLGVNAIELMPMAEFEGWAGWGYGTSHYFAIEYGSGGRDQFKHFVRACHQHGIAVIQDVVYNHFTHDGERAEWMYDSVAHDHNSYYWYYGKPSDYPSGREDGGYCDNGSTGYLPNFGMDTVRRMMIGSSVALLAEFHVDGFRVDLTQALHRDNVLHFDGRSMPAANQDGVRFMREWVRTLRLVKPSVVLLAEDHTGWTAMTQPQKIGGIGFDAIWWAQWYHHLIGDATNDSSKARLIHWAGLGNDMPLPMDWIAGTVLATPGTVVYHESHDEAGNSSYEENGQKVYSARTIQVAVNNALDAENRKWAEMRTRVAAGMTILSPGTPMFFMGEEVGASVPYRYNDFIDAREDYAAMRVGTGAGLFRFYQDLIRLRRSAKALISPEIEILHVHNANRVLAYRRWWGGEEFLVVVSLANRPFDGGYVIAHPSLNGSRWIEVLNSDADLYNGNNVCNPGIVSAAGDRLAVRLGAGTLAVFQKT